MNYDPNTLWSPDILMGPESWLPGFSKPVKLLGAQSEINSELLFVLKNMKEREKKKCYLDTCDKGFSGVHTNLEEVINFQWA